MYSLIFDKKALNFLNKLDKEMKNRIWDKLQQCKENPFLFVKHLEKISGYKIRVGDYRIIVDIDESSKTISVLKIGHRKNIYN